MAGYDYNQYPYGQGLVPGHPYQPYAQPHYDPNAYMGAYVQPPLVSQHGEQSAPAYYQQYGEGHPPPKKQRPNPSAAQNYHHHMAYAAQPIRAHPHAGYHYPAAAGFPSVPAPTIPSPYGASIQAQGWVTQHPGSWPATPQHAYAPPQAYYAPHGHYPPSNLQTVPTHSSQPAGAPNGSEAPHKPPFPSSLQWRKPKDISASANFPGNATVARSQAQYSPVSPASSKASVHTSNARNSRQTSGTPQSTHIAPPAFPTTNDHKHLEWDFESVDYWYKEGEAMNDDLSLGTIVWRPPKALRKVLPCFHHLAEEEATASEPSEEISGNGPISKFVLPQWFDKQCGPIWENEWEWPYIEDDPMFRPVTQESDIIPFEYVLALRNRSGSELVNSHDPSHSSSVRYEAQSNLHRTSSSPYLESQPSGRNAHSSKGPGSELSEEQSSPMDIDDDDDEDDESYSPPPADVPVMDLSTARNCTGLPSKTESMLPPTNHDREAPTYAEAVDEAPHQSNDLASTEGFPGLRPDIASDLDKYSKPQTLPPKPSTFARDEAQEDALAKLGVTGAPKPVFSIRGPAFAFAARRVSSDIAREIKVTSPSVASGSAPPSSLPPQPALAIADIGPSTIQTQYAQVAPPLPIPPPPPPLPEEPDDGNPWGKDGSRDSPKSETSQHTAAGSDFHDESNSTNTKAQEDQSIKSSKRTRDNSEDPEDGRRRQKDDVTPRLKRKQPKVAAAYSRRW